MYPLIVAAMTNKDSMPVIEYSLRSLLAQRGINLRVVIVDAYSTDGSDKLAEKLLKQYGIEYRMIKARSNIAQGRNIALRAALEYNPDYVFFIDSDTVLLYNNILATVAVISDKKKIIYINYNFEYYDKDKFKDKALFIIEKAIRESIDINEIICEKIKWGSLGATLIPASLAGKITLNESLSFAEDREFGLLSWLNNYPTVSVSTRRGNMAVDINIKGPKQNIYLRMGINEYLANLPYKVFIHDVWASYEENSIKTLKNFLKSKSLKRYMLHCGIDAFFVLALVLQSIGLIVPSVMGFIGYMAYMIEKKKVSFIDAFRQFAKFNMFSLGALLFFPLSFAHPKWRKVLKEAYNNYKAYSIDENCKSSLT